MKLLHSMRDTNIVNLIINDGTRDLQNCSMFYQIKPAYSNNLTLFYLLSSSSIPLFLRTAPHLRTVTSSSRLALVDHQVPYVPHLHLQKVQPQVEHSCQLTPSVDQRPVSCTAPVYDQQTNIINENEKKCPFCRTPEEHMKKAKARIEAGDAEAICLLGT